MKHWVKHSMTVLFGLMVYLVLIAINDVYSPNWNRWERGWLINAVEIIMSVGLSFGCIFIADKWEKWQRNKSYKATFPGIIKELFPVFLSVVLLINIIGGPIMEVTDNYDLHDVVVVNVVPALFTLIYYFVIRGNFYIRQYITNSVKLEKLENDKIREELKYLKNQIHPHFLFNALNTIYFQMDENVTQAKRSVEMFSDLLRYRLYDNQGEKASLQKELEFIQNYIAFEKLRHSDKLKTEIKIPQVEVRLTIYPFLINPLVENAFKYVGGEMCIKIEILVEDHLLTVNVRNSKCAESDSHKKGGIGLSNLRRRLELLYPERFELVCQDQGMSYVGKLTIDLDAA